MIPLSAQAGDLRQKNARHGDGDDADGQLQQALRVVEGGEDSRTHFGGEVLVDEEGYLHEAMSAERGEEQGEKSSSIFLNTSSFGFAGRAAQQGLCVDSAAALVRKKALEHAGSEQGGKQPEGENLRTDIEKACGQQESDERTVEHKRHGGVEGEVSVRTEDSAEKGGRRN